VSQNELHTYFKLDKNSCYEMEITAVVPAVLTTKFEPKNDKAISLQFVASYVLTFLTFVIGVLYLKNSPPPHLPHPTAIAAWSLKVVIL
jgi:hypothetical protein